VELGYEPDRRSAVSDQGATNSDLIEIVKRNGDFRKNYGLITGALLYLRSISAARGGSFWWNGLPVTAAGVVCLLEKYGWPPLLSAGPS
jgi:hypothetical protein